MRHPTLTCSTDSSPVQVLAHVLARCVSAKLTADLYDCLFQLYSCQGFPQLIVRPSTLWVHVAAQAATEQYRILHQNWQPAMLFAVQHRKSQKHIQEPTALQSAECTAMKSAAALHVLHDKLQHYCYMPANFAMTPTRLCHENISGCCSLSNTAHCSLLHDMPTGRLET